MSNRKIIVLTSPQDDDDTYNWRLIEEFKTNKYVKFYGKHVPRQDYKIYLFDISDWILEVHIPNSILDVVKKNISRW